MKIKKRWVYVIAMVIIFLVGVFYFTGYIKPEQTTEERITVTFNGVVKDNISASADNVDFKEYYTEDIQTISHPKFLKIKIFRWGIIGNGWVELDIEILSTTQNQTIQEIIDILKSKWYTLDAYKPGRGVLL